LMYLLNCIIPFGPEAVDWMPCWSIMKDAPERKGTKL
jgi:hypothetical protein